MNYLDKCNHCRREVTVSPVPCSVDYTIKSLIRTNYLLSVFLSSQFICYLDKKQLIETL